MLDRYYTPSSLAELMMRDVAGESFPIIADFTAGDGALLRMAKKYWAGSTFIATDMNATEVSLLKAAEPTWRVGRCDFLKLASTRRCNALRNIAGQVSLVLLNSPFSCRGATYREVKLDGVSIRCGVALAFLLSCLRFLSQDGLIIAILPTGCLQTEKDLDAWSFIHSLYSVDITAHNKSNIFAGCKPRTVIAQLRPKQFEEEAATPLASLSSGSAPVRGEVEVTRGSVPMHTVITYDGEGSLPFVHSTELKGTHVNAVKRHTLAHRAVQGPVVLMPRVGRPDRSKVTLYTDGNALVLSDCVMALKCDTEATAHDLMHCMNEFWQYFETAYGGTGAKYITVNKLYTLLSRFGFNVK